MKFDDNVEVDVKDSDEIVSVTCCYVLIVWVLNWSC